jgi:hypothetical protein
MQGFWVKKDVVLQHAGKTHRLLPPTQEAISSRKIPLSSIYCGNIVWEIIQARHQIGVEQVEDLGRLNTQNLPLPLEINSNFPINKLLEIKNHKQPGIIKIALLNGMGTMVGDTIVGCQALEIAIERISQLTDRKVEVDVYLAWNARPGTERLIERVNGVTNVIEHSLTLQELQHYEAYWDFSNLLLLEGYENINLIDFYLKSLGIDSTTVSVKSKLPLIRTPESILEDARNLLFQRSNGKPIIHIQGEASNPLRSMPHSDFERLAKSILEHTDAHLLITQKIEQPFFESNRLINLSDWSSQSIDHYLALIESVQAVVSVDTLAVHAAIAFNLPGIGIFSSIEPHLRVGYANLFKGKKLPNATTLPCWGKHKSDENWMEYADAYNQAWASIDFKPWITELLQTTELKQWQPKPATWLVNYSKIAPLQSSLLQLHGKNMQSAFECLAPINPNVQSSTSISEITQNPTALAIDAECFDQALLQTIKDWCQKASSSSQLDVLVRNYQYHGDITHYLRLAFAQPNSSIQILKNKLSHAGLANFQEIALDTEPLPAAVPLNALSTWLKTDRVKLESQLCTKYWLLRSTKTITQNLNVGALTLRKIAGVNEPRIDQPLTLLRGYPSVQVSWQSDGFQVPKGWQPGVLILHRQFLNTPKIQEGIEGFIAKGWIVVLEIDDDPHHWPAYVNSNFHAFKAVHGVSVSTKPIADLVKKWNSEVQVFENQIFKLPNRKNLHIKSNDKLRIFYGALNRKKDWQSIMPAVKLAIDQFGDKLIFVVVHDQEFYDALKTDNKEFNSTLPPEEYFAVLSTCHVALLPLLDNPFNRMKSDLKFIECCAAGVVPIASPTVYASVSEHKQIAWIANTTKQWHLAIKEALSDFDQLKAKSSSCLEYVKSKRMLYQHIEQRYQWLQSLRENFEALEQQRKRRLTNL